MTVVVEGGGAGSARTAPPTIPSATVRRRALLERLDADPGQRFVLVSAAAGSGKSALLADWAGTLDVPVVWYGCSDADTDAGDEWFWTRLERTLLAGLAPIGMVGAEVLTPAATPVEALLGQLAAVTSPAVVVIDDLHLAPVRPADLVALISGLPSTLRLVVATRVDPPFSLARMRLHGTLLELRQEDLRFSEAETVAALASFELGLAEGELAQLHELTEGWPAGVHLVGIALRDRAGASGRSEALVDLAAHDRNLGEYLLAEVIDRQPPELRSFLQVTALFRSFDPELHDAVTGRTDGLAMLAEVRARNLFLVQLDTTPPTYRYHHLVQELLRLRFAAEDPAAVDRVHRRAAEVHEARHDYAAALPHLLACGQLDQARVLLGREATETASLLQPDGATVARRWLAEHGEARVATDPTGLLECILGLNAAGFHAEAELWLRRWSEAEPRLGTRGRALLHGAWSQHHLFTGDPAACLAEATVSRRLMDLEPLDDGWREVLSILEVQGCTWIGDLDGARAAIADAEARLTLSLPLALVRMPGFSAAIDVLEGALGPADDAAAGALRMADELGLPDRNFGRGEPELARAEVALDQGRAHDAEHHLERALAIAEGRRPPVELLALLVAARLAAAQGRREDVADALARARSIFRTPSVDVLARIDATEARIALQHGDRRAALDAIARLPEGPVGELLRARVSLAAGATERAAEHLAAAGPAPDHLRGAIDVGLVAVLVHPPGDRVDALAALAGHLAAAAPQRLVRPFLDEGPALWDLLAEVPVTGHVAAFRDEVLAASREIVPVARVGDQSALIDPLSERELMVLRYLASRLDRSEIAASLYISVNTVRSHVKAIYRKLGVNSRPEAVARARQLDLI